MAREGRRHVGWRLLAATAAAGLGLLPLATPALADPTTPPPAPSVAPNARPAIITAYVTQSGSDLLATGTLRDNTNTKPLAGDKVDLIVDGAPKASNPVDADGNWQLSASLKDIPDGSHTIVMSFAGAGENGPAKVQVQMATRKPQSPSVLTGSLATGVAAPGDEITAQGTLKADDQAISNGLIKLQIKDATTTAQTTVDGNYSVKGTVPKDAQIGSTLTVVITYPGDAGHPAATLNLPLMVQKVAPPPPSSAAPSQSASSESGAAQTPAQPSSAASNQGRLNLPAIGFSTMAPFIIIGLLSLAAAGGLGYYLYKHRDSEIFGGDR